jgi:hypothetical protein
MNWELIITLTGLMLFAYWFTYVVGSPLADDPKNIDGGAILVALPYELAIRRLVKAGIWKGIELSHIQDLDVTSDPKTRAQMKKDHVVDTIEAGRTFFTWERSMLCPICLHFWLTVLVGLVFILFDIMHARAEVFLAAFVYLANHYIIRKIS